LFYAGRYAYTVDGKFAGSVIAAPAPRFVTLTARTHAIRVGTRLRLHGRVVRSSRSGCCGAPPAPVVVLARHNGAQRFTSIATVRTRFQGNDHRTYAWSVLVHPDAATTYIAEVTGQRLCYFPAFRCAVPHGQVWTNPKSRPFTVRIRH
jgi:hypothetical protein